MVPGHEDSTGDPQEREDARNTAIRTGSQIFDKSKGCREHDRQHSSRHAEHDAGTVVMAIIADGGKENDAGESNDGGELVLFARVGRDRPEERADESHPCSEISEYRVNQDKRGKGRRSVIS